MKRVFDNTKNMGYNENKEFIMKDEKGFTLIELIAVIAVIGIIMLIAAPNIASMADKNNRTAYLNDAKKMVKLAKYQFAQTTTNHPAPNNCIKYKITNLDRSELQNPPNDGSYDFDQGNYSYVTITYDNNPSSSTYQTYRYQIQLVEQYQKNNTTYYRGVTYTESSALLDENAKIKYITTTYKDLNQSPFQRIHNISC